MTTTIHSMGSKWYGEAPDPVSGLFTALESSTLDPTFEDYGDFVESGDPAIPVGSTRFFGNFYDLSYVFNMDTDDVGLIARLTAAIRENQKSQAYAEARKGVDAWASFCKANAAEANRRR